MPASQGDKLDESATTATGSADGPWTIRRLVQWIHRHLEAKDIDSPRVSAEILIGHVLGCDRLRLYMESERVPTDAERAQLRALVARSARHEPVQYLVGEWPFYGRTFALGPATLIPRPATETLVEAAVRWYREEHAGCSLAMADIGTGTGVIAVSVIAEIRAWLRSERGRAGCRPLGGAAPKVPSENVVPEIQIGVRSGSPDGSGDPVKAHGELPRIHCVATEIVAGAAALARSNVERHGLADAIEVREGSLFAPFRVGATKIAEGSLDLICANPPYISDSEWLEVPPNVKLYEPATALRAGVDGLDVICPLVRESARWLRPGGLLLVEIAASQGDAVRTLFAEAAGVWSGVTVLRDHQGHWRVASGRRG